MLDGDVCTITVLFQTVQEDEEEEEEEEEILLVQEEREESMDREESFVPLPIKEQMEPKEKEEVKVSKMGK